MSRFSGLKIEGEFMHSAVNQLRSLGILFGGAPGFFTPRVPPPFLNPPGSPEALSFYDVAPLKATRSPRPAWMGHSASGTN